MCLGIRQQTSDLFWCLVCSPFVSHHDCRTVVKLDDEWIGNNVLDVTYLVAVEIYDIVKCSILNINILNKVIINIFNFVFFLGNAP